MNSFKNIVFMNYFNLIIHFNIESFAYVLTILATMSRLKEE